MKHSWEECLNPCERNLSGIPGRCNGGYICSCHSPPLGLFYQPCLDCGGSKDILDLRICGQHSVCGLSYEPASDCSAGI